jgi:hypothetical protein
MAQSHLLKILQTKNGKKMPPIKTDFKRKSGLRDARLFVIAAEGCDTEKLYFEAIKNTFKNTRIHIEVLNRTDFGIAANNSSPKDVLKTLDEFKKLHNLKKDDQLWLIIDRDRQNVSDKQLSEVAKQVVQKKYFLGLTNPCFEFWLVLHFENPNDFDAEKQATYLKNEKTNEKRLLERILSEHIGGYSKSVYKTDLLMQNIRTAIAHAKALPLPENERWHTSIGTQVGDLVAQLVPNV